MTLPQRKPLRLKSYDYSNPNCYFVTICTHENEHIFGEPDKLNAAGAIAQSELVAISRHFSKAIVDKYVIMPNRIHAIITLEQSSDKSVSLSAIVGLYKSGVSKRVHKIMPNASVWQRSFYDRVIRNEKGYIEAWRYIDENPLKWCEDEYYAPPQR